MFSGLSKLNTERLAKLSDVEIIERIVQQSEKELLGILYDRYANKVFHKCLMIVKDSEISKDLTHDIMVKVFLNLSGFKGKSAFSLWVHSITYNHCMDYLRKKKRIRYQDYTETTMEERIPDNESELEEKLIKEMKLNQLETLFNELKPDDRMILLMRYQDGMSVKQVSDILSLGQSAVKMRLKRSRDRLAQLVRENQHDK